MQKPAGESFTVCCHEWHGDGAAEKIGAFRSWAHVWTACLYLMNRVEKPGVGFFECIFKKLGEIDRKEVMIVGDSLTSDMQGGNTAGNCMLLV